MPNAPYAIRGKNLFPPIEQAFLLTKMDEFCSLNGKKSVDHSEQDSKESKRAGKPKAKSNQLQAFLSAVLAEYKVAFPYRDPGADLSKFPQEQKILQNDSEDWGKLSTVSARPYGR